MHYKISFNALIMPCNAPYNALYNIIIVTTVNTLYVTVYQFIVTLNILSLFIIIYDKIWCITMHIMNNYNALYLLITLYNALYTKALSKVLPICCAVF